MINVLMCLALLWQFYLGYKRGLVKQLYLLLAFVIAVVIAGLWYRPLAAKLTFWIPYTQAIEEKTLFYFPQVSIFDMDAVFYAGISFLGVSLIVYLILKSISIFLSLLPFKPFDQLRFRLVGGVLSVLVTLMFWSMILMVLATIPFEPVQNILVNSPVILALIRFPILSTLMTYFWVG